MPAASHRSRPCRPRWSPIDAASRSAPRNSCMTCRCWWHACPPASMFSISAMTAIGSPSGSRPVWSPASAASLPSTHTPEVIRQLRAFAPDVFCLSDDPQCPLDLPQLLYRESGAAVNAQQAGACEFQCRRSTPRSSRRTCSPPARPGTPVPHAKTWGRLVQLRARRSDAAGADRSGAAARSSAPCRRSTCMASNPPCCCRCRAAARCAPSGRSFRPISRRARARLPRPRVLISTPVHLRALLGARVPLPALELIVSATAMLPANLAREVESALRRAAAGDLRLDRNRPDRQPPHRTRGSWRLWPGVQLDAQTTGSCWAQGGHVERPIAAGRCARAHRRCDSFVLHGRTADLVNIAGKRSSLAYLNHQLNAIPGVVDGAFFVRDDSAGLARRRHAAGGAGSGPAARRGAHHRRRCASASIRYSCRGRCCWWSTCRAMPPANCRSTRCRRWPRRRAVQQPHLFA